MAPTRAGGWCSFFGFARFVADRVIFMAEGAIIEQAPPSQFFSDPKEARTRAFLGEILRH